MESPLLLLYVTFPSTESAEAITKTLLSEHHIACANQLATSQSTYWWQGKLESSTEVIVIFKTLKAKKLAAVARLEQLHPYQTPCWIEIPTKDCNLNYLQWVNSSLL